MGRVKEHLAEATRREARATKVIGRNKCVEPLELLQSMSVLVMGANRLDGMDTMDMGNLSNDVAASYAANICVYDGNNALHAVEVDVDDDGDVDVECVDGQGSDGHLDDSGEVVGHDVVSQEDAAEGEGEGANDGGKKRRRALS